MKIDSKALLISSSVVLFLLGLGLMIAPEPLIALRTGGEPDMLTIHIARQFATLCIALGFIAWLIRNEGRSKARDSIILGIIFAFLILPIETAVSIFLGSETSEGWVLVGIFSLLALGLIFIVKPKIKTE